MIIIQNSRLVPELTEGFAETSADIVIEGERIREILPAGTTVNREAERYDNDITVIDAAGKTLIPGLIEAHAHLYGYVYDPYELQCAPAGKIIFGVLEFAQEYLRQGYTTIRDCGSSYNAVFHVREAINKGLVIGPRLISSGLIITPTETGNDTFADLYSVADGPESVRRACREELAKGNDFIKVMASGAFLNEGGDPGVQIMDQSELDMAVNIAKMKGTYVSAHAHGTESIKAAFRAGVRTIEHASFIDDEGIDMIGNSDRSFIIPTAGIGLYFLDPTSTSISDDSYQKTLRYMDQEIHNLNKCYESGLKLGFGSDLDLVAVQGKLGYEFIARKEYYTFGDKDILLQATRNNAEILGLSDEIGTIKVGKIADLVLVDEKPDENIYEMAKPVVCVICKGSVVDI